MALLSVSEKSSRLKQLPIIAAGLLLLISGIGLVWFLGQQKSVGTVKPISFTPTQMPANSPPGLTQYQGKYVTFSYPSDFQVREDTQAVKFPVLERQIWLKNDVAGQKIALLVQERGDAPLEEYSSYHFRDMEREAYTKEKIEKQSMSFTLFTKKEAPFEVGAFWSVKNMAMSLVISSPTRSEGLRDLLFSLLDTVSLNEKK